jgi:hypothetical protein
MNSPARATGAMFATANPHALATILEASQTRSIIASRDIFDIAGIKLWARDQPVSAALQRKLLDRELRNPLESCLRAEDGITPQTLLRATEALVEHDSPIAALLKPHAARIVAQVSHLPLHPVAQLLLTAGHASRPESFDHAVQAMALAGALMAEHSGSVAELRLAMLAGLLHDLGEMYIDPRYGEADADRLLDFTSYQQLVVHPHIGRLLLTQLTNYPGAVVEAVAEHHERLDGSGYPHGLQRDTISPLGKLLAVTEGALAVLRGERPYLARISVALRVVPGEYELGWVGGIADAARMQPALHAELGADEVQARLAQLDDALQDVQRCADALAGEVGSTALKGALGLAQTLLARLRKGWYASGLWSAGSIDAVDAAEIEAVEDELFFRLRSIERATKLRAGQLNDSDAIALQRLYDSLNAAAR